MHRGSNIFVALGEDLGGGRWSLRIQIRPLVNFIWLAALHHGARRGARGLGPALPHRSRPRGRGRRAQARPEAARVNRFLLPLGAVRAARRRAGHRHQALARQGHDRLAADRQAGAAVLAAESHRPGAPGALGGPQRALVPVQRLGHAGAWSAATSTRCCSTIAAAGRVPIIGLDWQDEDAEALALAAAARQSLRDRGRGPRRAARRSTGACTARRRPSW